MKRFQRERSLSFQRERAVFESFVKSQRPISVDLGSSTVNNQPIILIILKICTFSCFKGAADKIDKNVQLKTQREKAIRDADVIKPCNEDPDRLLPKNKASQCN